MKRILRRIHDHWFAPASLQDLAIVRIAVVGFELLILLWPWLARGAGICHACNLDYTLLLADFPDGQFLAIPTLKVLMLPFGEWGVRPEPMFLTAVWMLAVVSGLGALVGLYSKLSLLVFAATTTLLNAHGYSYGEAHHTEAALMIGLWLLAFSPAGARLSVDDYLRRLDRVRATGQFEPRTWSDDQSELARWPLRTGQWVLAITYLSAGIAKIVNGGWAWLNGYTLANHVGLDAIRHGRPVGLWAAQQVWLLRAMSVFTVGFELLFVLAVLVPGVAWLFVLTGLAMHGGIYVLQAAPFFQTMVLYIVFIEPVRNALAKVWLPKPRGRLAVIYDGRSPTAQRSMLLLETVDLRHALSYLDIHTDSQEIQRRAGSLEPDVPAVYVVDAAGRMYGGWPGFRRLARSLPLLWPLLPLVYLAGVVRATDPTPA